MTTDDDLRALVTLGEAIHAAHDAIESLLAERDKEAAAHAFHAEQSARLHDEVVVLTKELDALRADAERYRWLRTQPTWLGWDHDFRPDEIEREIDAVRGASDE